MSRYSVPISSNSVSKIVPEDQAGIKGSTTNQYGERLGGDVITAADGNPVVRIEDLISIS